MSNEKPPLYPDPSAPAPYPDGPPPAPGAPVPPAAGVTYVAPPPQPQQPHVVVVGSPVPHFGTHPVSMQCPNCHEHIQTTVKYETGGVSWLIFFAFCLVGLCTIVGWCLSLCVFCVDDLQDAVHTCPNCKQHLGTRKPFGMQ